MGILVPGSVFLSDL